MNDYYDRQGVPIISVDAWAQMFEHFETRRVGATHLPNGFLVSTVWLGLDHNHWSPGNPPIIFESMVFRDCRDAESYCQVRYATEEEAIAGHERLVHRWQMKRRRTPQVYSKRPPSRTRSARKSRS